MVQYMRVHIEIDGAWRSCELFSPHNELPIKSFLPGGIQYFEPVYPQYNAKILFDFPRFVILPGIYKVRINDKIVEFDAKSPKGNTVYGDILYS